MKKLILGALFSLCYFALFAQNSYNITFVNKYKGENFKPEKIYLFSIEERMAIDSTTGENGTFTLKGNARMPQLVSICGDNKGMQVVVAFILDETNTNITLENGVQFVQQSGDVIIVSSRVLLRNNSRLESTTNRSNSNSTLTPIKNDTNSTSSDTNVEAMLNTSYNYQKKKGAGIRDSLPGIINKFG